jgi:hypothetical protein
VLLICKSLSPQRYTLSVASRLVTVLSPAIKLGEAFAGILTSQGRKKIGSKRPLNTLVLEEGPILWTSCNLKLGKPLLSDEMFMLQV